MVRLTPCFSALLCATALFASCQRAGEAAKNTINKGGEVAGQAASEFLKGAKEGVEETLALPVVLDTSLSDRGLSVGKTEATGGEGYHTLNVYLIFDRDLSDSLMAKAYDADGLEMGRVRFGVHGKAGDAAWQTITFPEQTDLEAKGKVVLERVQ
ncbi:MAG: hypothetical protein WAU70_08105 [Flavobacteriales bacterium]